MDGRTNGNKCKLIRLNWKKQKKNLNDQNDSGSNLNSIICILAKKHKQEERNKERITLLLLKKLKVKTILFNLGHATYECSGLYSQSKKKKKGLYN